MPEMNETMNELVVISGHLYSHCLASTPLPPSQPNSHPIPPSNQPTAMSSMPELRERPAPHLTPADQWTSTAEKDTEGNEKPRPPRYRGACGRVGADGSEAAIHRPRAGGRGGQRRGAVGEPGRAADVAGGVVRDYGLGWTSVRCAR
ncbi:hypothetical protein CC85DRAFT_327403 [Cutaneotrichosporon oleaginosum]|uniref:Uncharacterized protein n=1 Tax=Cutaneotrichosporon oleaginosum TaxID=879819 RepID=A0A0J0XQ71_9TREE|nr:uncharacterized protein CC85DRAFT_327403 [Cutaneotrichosporon oleaginosum]KLT43266.1 hypothetical protein CC85DRAFT_327403 [Cutaneotrichosporon oleaginosum]